MEYSAGRKAKSEYSFDSFFRKGYASVLYGKSGIGKTAISLYISLMANRGRNLFGRILKVDTPKKVAYVSLELYREDILERLEPIKKKYKVKDHSIDFFDTEQVYKFDDLAKILRKNPYDFVVVDSFVAFYDKRSLYDPVEVKNFLYEVRRLAKKVNTHILFIHHTAKSLEDKGENSYQGVSTIKFLTTPFLYAYTYRGNLCSLKVEKSNFNPPFKDIKYYIDKEGAIRWYSWDKENIKEVEGKYQSILKHLRNKPEGIRTEELLELSGLKKRTFYLYLNRLEDMGLIEWSHKYSDVSRVSLTRKAKFFKSFK